MTNFIFKTICDISSNPLSFIGMHVHSNLINILSSLNHKRESYSLPIECLLQGLLTILAPQMSRTRVP